MPELPEAETIKCELSSAIKGKRVVDVIVNNAKVIKEPSASEFAKQLKGCTIKNILRKGKLLILELSSGKSLTIHLKLTGQLIYPGEPGKARVSFKLSDGKFLDFRDARLLGELRLIEDWQSLQFIKELGPEPFNLSEKQFVEMLSKKKTKIKPLLMDQTFISGVGNLYVAEALFRAKIHPERPANKMSGKEKGILFKEIKDVLRQAIEHKGSSVDAYVQLSGKPGGFVKYHKVYGREGLPCFVCKTSIKRILLGGRGTYFCPKCQR